MNWVGFLWIAALVNLGLGLGLSTATGLHNVSVQGANDAGELKAVKKRLTPWASIPWVRQSREAMETALLADNRLAAVEVKTNIFGRGEVKLTHRIPVARIDPLAGTDPKKVPDSAIYLDSLGVLYRDSRSIAFSGPALEMPTAARAIQLTAIPTWPLRSAANVAAKSQGFLGELPFKVVLDERSVISLQLVDGPLIILGTESDLDEKFAVLEQAFVAEKEQVLRYKLINVSAPDRPVYSP